jgi:hypothetical protein
VEGIEEYHEDPVEFCGKIPEREELECTGKSKGWKLRLDSGAPVYKKSECGGKDYKEWPVVKDPEGIKVGDIVYTCILGAYVEGKVKCDKDIFYVDTTGNYTNLFYAKYDGELCWVTNISMPYLGHRG